MILADKIIMLRKKNGWSQEELAQKLNVTRQSVSKWEGAQSVPDLNKILQMSEIFGVSTDYLLKDDIETEEHIKDSEPSAIRKVSLEEANDFLEVKEKTSKSIAFATFLCIISPFCLLLLGAATELKNPPISENAAGAIGIIALLVIVTIAAAIFIISGMKTKPYEFLDGEDIETDYGVSGMVQERRKQYQNTYMMCNVIGTCVCILSPIPLLAGAFLTGENVFYIMMTLCATMLLAAIGVQFFIIAGIKWASFEKLLQEGDYTKDKKEKNSTMEAVSGIYWIVTTAAFLAYSFITNDWEHSWIIWPVAGVLYAAVATVVQLVTRKK